MSKTKRWTVVLLGIWLLLAVFLFQTIRDSTAISVNEVHYFADACLLAGGVYLVREDGTPPGCYDRDHAGELGRAFELLRSFQSPAPGCKPRTPYDLCEVAVAAGTPPPCSEESGELAKLCRACTKDGGLWVAVAAPGDLFAPGKACAIPARDGGRLCRTGTDCASYACVAREDTQRTGLGVCAPVKGWSYSGLLEDGVAVSSRN